MKSLLARQEARAQALGACALTRQERRVTVQKHGRLYTFLARDKVAVEDPYLVLVKAEAFALQQGESYQGQAPSRALKDFLLKTNVGSGG